MKLLIYASCELVYHLDSLIIPTFLSLFERCDASVCNLFKNSGDLFLGNLTDRFFGKFVDLGFL